MSALKQPLVSAVEYFAMDRDSEERLELEDGVVIPVEAATRSHSLISVNITSGLHSELRTKGCEVYANTMRVTSAAGRRYFYPDIVVACGDPKFEDRLGETLLNPTAIVEVLSKSTSDRDRGRKFENYRDLQSLQHYVLVDQYRPLIELYDRNANGTWTYSVLSGLKAALSLSRLGVTLPLTEIYERVTFPTLNEDNEPLDEAAG